MNAMRTIRLRIDALGVLMLGVIGSAAYFAGVTPLVQAAVARDALELEVQNLSMHVETQQAATRGYAEAIEVIDDRLSQRPVTLGSVDRLSETLSWLSEAAEESGILIDSMTPKPTEKGKGLDRVPIELRGKGSYPSVIALLSDVRSREVALVPRQLELRAEDGQQHDAVFVVELVWFVRSATPAG